MSIQCRRYEYDSPDYKAALALRTEILRDPLGLKFDPKELKLEANAFHFGAFQDGEIVGTLMLVRAANDPEALKMRQVAVAGDRQDQGIGSALVKYAESFARQEGYRQIQLHARDTAVPFYMALGYEKQGDEFFEVTIPHQAMVKVL